jgi:hypothetical protein
VDTSDTTALLQCISDANEAVSFPIGMLRQHFLTVFSQLLTLLTFVLFK